MTDEGKNVVEAMIKSARQEIGEGPLSRLAARLCDLKSEPAPGGVIAPFWDDDPPEVKLEKTLDRLLAVEEENARLREELRQASANLVEAITEE